MLNIQFFPEKGTSDYLDLISRLVLEVIKGRDISSLIKNAEKDLKHVGERHEVEDLMFYVVHDTFECALRFRGILHGVEGEETKQQLEQALKEYESEGEENDRKCGEKSGSKGGGDFNPFSKKDFNAAMEDYHRGRRHRRQGPTSGSEGQA